MGLYELPRASNHLFMADVKEPLLAFFLAGGIYFSMPLRYPKGYSSSLYINVFLSLLYTAPILSINSCTLSL